ncbi:hypothetical protein S40293_05688 [Stachybotrys chartarum IBT 40293]|nr:hypothetical protein S40293_05688 [Stachybotrys chartarum IBT 40293]
MNSIYAGLPQELMQIVDSHNIAHQIPCSSCSAPFPPAVVNGSIGTCGQCGTRTDWLPRTCDCADCADIHAPEDNAYDQEASVQEDMLLDSSSAGSYDRDSPEKEEPPWRDTSDPTITQFRRCEHEWKTIHPRAVYYSCGHLQSAACTRCSVTSCLPCLSRMSTDEAEITSPTETSPSMSSPAAQPVSLCYDSISDSTNKDGSFSVTETESDREGSSRDDEQEDEGMEDAPSSGNAENLIGQSSLASTRPPTGDRRTRASRSSTSSHASTASMSRVARPQLSAARGGRARLPSQPSPCLTFAFLRQNQMVDRARDRTLPSRSRQEPPEASFPTSSAPRTRFNGETLVCNQSQYATLMPQAPDGGYNMVPESPGLPQRPLTQYRPQQLSSTSSISQSSGGPVGTPPPFFQLIEAVRAQEQDPARYCSQPPVYLHPQAYIVPTTPSHQHVQSQYDLQYQPQPQYYMSSPYYAHPQYCAQSAPPNIGHYHPDPEPEEYRQNWQGSVLHPLQAQYVIPLRGMQHDQPRQPQTRYNVQEEMARLALPSPIGIYQNPPGHLGNCHEHVSNEMMLELQQQMEQSRNRRLKARRENYKGKNRAQGSAPADNHPVGPEEGVLELSPSTSHEQLQDQNLALETQAHMKQQPHTPEEVDDDDA